MIKRKFKSVKNILADNGYDDYYKEFEKRDLTSHYKIFKMAINGKLKQEFDKIFGDLDTSDKMQDVFTYYGRVVFKAQIKMISIIFTVAIFIIILILILV